MRGSKSRSGLTLIEVVVVIVVLLIIAALLLPAAQRTRVGSRKTQCRNNLKQIGLALHTYHDIYGVFPYNSTAGLPKNEAPESTGGHSWVASILPYLDQSAFYQKIDFNSGAASEHNKSWFLKAKLTNLQCPSDEHVGKGGPLPSVTGRSSTESRQPFFSGWDGWTQGWYYPVSLGTLCVDGTNYIDVTATIPGPNNDELRDTTTTDGTCGTSQGWFASHAAGKDFPGMFGRGVSNISLRDCTDGTANVILAGERCAELIHEGSAWGSTSVTAAGQGNLVNSMSIDSRGSQTFRYGGGFSSQHTGGVNVLRVDGTVIFISEMFDPILWRRLGDRADGHELDNSFGK